MCHLHKNKIFQEALEDECEVIMIYKSEKYHGYIDMKYPLNIMVSEYESEYEPVALTFNDSIIDMAYEQFKKCKNLTLIPLDLVYTNNIMVFICNRPDEEYMAALCVLDTYAENARIQKLFMEKLLDYKDEFILDNLDEFTFRCYQILKDVNVKIRCEGYLWPIVGICARCF